MLRAIHDMFLINYKDPDTEGRGKRKETARWLCLIPVPGEGISPGAGGNTGVPMLAHCPRNYRLLV